MTCRQPCRKSPEWPTTWLMTDARFGDDQLPAIRRLPFGSGVVFRHYHLEPKDRVTLFRRVARICRQRGHMLILAGSERDAVRWRADGFHARAGGKISALARSAPVHDKIELREALRGGADLLFVSPLFATASHPGDRPLGRHRFAALAKLRGRALVIALGGVNHRSAKMLNRRLAHGWAAIDAFRKTID